MQNRSQQNISQPLVQSDQVEPRFIMRQPPQSQAKSQLLRQYHPLFKFAILSFIITGFLVYRFLFPSPKTSCIGDAIQDATQSANRDFAADPSKGAVYQGNGNQLSLTGKAMIGTGQVLMDLWIGIFGIVWLVKTKSMRPLVAFGAFFVTRSAIFLNVQSFPFPQDIVWKNPGFFSFTVPYDHTRDFFYSGHTGTLAVIVLEMYTVHYRVLTVLALLSLIFMINLLITTKVHYTADIIGGLVFSAFMHRTSTRVVFYADKLASFPYWLFLKIHQRCRRQGENQAQNQRMEIQPVTTERNLEGKINNLPRN